MSRNLGPFEIYPCISAHKNSIFLSDPASFCPTWSLKRNRFKILRRKPDISFLRKSLACHDHSCNIAFQLRCDFDIRDLVYASMQSV